VIKKLQIGRHRCLLEVPMPFYDYQCEDCTAEMTVKASISNKEEGLEVTCEKCGSKNTRQVYRSMAFIGAGKEQAKGPCGHNCACYPGDN